MGRSLTRWLIPLPAILFAVFPQIANAEPIQGLNAVGYTVSEIPPTKSDDIYPVCHSELENNINRNFNGEPFGVCPVDLFMVHYTGFIEIPANNTIKFMVAADDGGTIKIGTTEFGTWNDKGCSWSAITTDLFPAGSYAVDGWFYEHGGSSCFMLAWDINQTGWAIVPDEAFTTNGAPATTTTLLTTTTLTSTTTTTSTTIQPTTTTTTSTTTSTSPPATTTTTIPATTTTQTTTTSTSPATTTTTTEAPYTPPQTSTSAPLLETTTTTTTLETTTTTTSLPESTTTQTKVETSVQDTVIEADDTTTTSKPAPDSTQTTVPNETETTLPPPPDDDSEGLETIVEPVISIETNETGEISEEVFEQILDEIAAAEPEKVVAIVESILATNITQDQAVELVVSPVILEAITEQQAEAIFETIVQEELTLEQADQMSEVLSEAPKKVKKAFEKIIDIFGSQFEKYVATGSNIPVEQRRTLVAIGGLLTMMPAPTTRVKR